MTGAITSATAPVAAEIIAGLPPKNAMETAIVNDANKPTRGSTPAMMENEIASGINASATTSPPRTSVRNMRGLRSAVHTEVMFSVRALRRSMGLVGFCPLGSLVTWFSIVFMRALHGGLARKYAGESTQCWFWLLGFQIITTDFSDLGRL